MPTRHRRAVVRVLVPALVVGLALVLLNNAPLPFAWIAGLFTVSLGISAWRRAWPLQPFAWFNLAVACAAFGGMELYLADPGVSSPKMPLARKKMPPGYFVPGGELGYRPGTGTWQLRATVDGREVYSVETTIGPGGLRRVPGPASRDAEGSVLFFGGSFTFGEGLTDDQTLPARFEDALGGSLRAYNFGFHGYGPHHMLAQIEDGLVERSVSAPPVAAVYSLIRDHRERALGSRWDSQGPWYDLDARGDLVRRGSFDEREAESGGDSLGSELAERALRSAVVRAIAEKSALDVRLFIAVVERARDELRSRFPGIRFMAVVWDRSGRGIGIIVSELRRKGIPVILVSDVLPGYEEDPRRYFLSPDDGHPSAEANHLLARALADALRRGE